LGLLSQNFSDDGVIHVTFSFLSGDLKHCAVVGRLIPSFG